MAYAAKYASALYGPFRDAVDVSIVGGGDRKGYQQDWRNAREARREIGPGAGIIFKGSGFYQTDYRSDSYKKSAEADRKSQESASSKSESKSSDGGSAGKPDKSSGKSDSKPKKSDS